MNVRATTAALLVPAAALLVSALACGGSRGGGAAAPGAPATAAPAPAGAVTATAAPDPGAAPRWRPPHAGGVDDGAGPMGVGAPLAPPAPPAPRVWLTPAAVSWPTDRRPAQFHALGGGAAHSAAVAVSADGSTPVGVARPAGGHDEAVRWRDGRLEPLGTLDLPGLDRSVPRAVSRDGRIVVGESTATEATAVAGVWRDGGAPERLPLPPGVDAAVAVAVSRDGSIIAGCVTGDCDQVVRWQRGAVAAVATPRPFHLAAHAMSDDGKVLAGNGGEPLTAARVTARGVAPLGADGRVEGLSDDGTIAVGHVGDRAALWRRGRLTDLGVVPGYDLCVARAVSADGGRVVGTCVRRSTWVPVADEPRPPPDEPRASVAFVWDRRHGMRPVADALAAAGVTLPAGWWLDEAFDICAYGLTIVGDGRSPTAASEAWLAIVPR